MDPISNALTVAWLDAVARVQSERVYQQPVSRDERSLTDVIESALRSGGPDSNEPNWVDPLQPGSTVDRLA